MEASTVSLRLRRVPRQAHKGFVRRLAWNRRLFTAISLVFVGSLASGQIITTVAGGGVGSDGSLATSASIYDPHGGVFDRNGNLYIVEGQGHKIRKIDRVTGVITTVAGTGNLGYNGDGIPATTANITPNSIAIDTLGNLFITDSVRIRKISIATGIISTIGGGGAIIGDGGPATNVKIQVPWGICIDKHGNLYFGEVIGYKLRKINTSGIISTVAGNGIAGFSGDNGPASASQCGQIFGLCVDDIGNIYFVDGVNNYRIRKISTTGKINTIAGNGVSAYNGDGIQATDAHIDPLDIRIDPADNLYVADFANSRIRKVSKSGIIVTVAGTGINGYNGDNIIATSAQINRPGGLAIDACGNIYFGDVNNARFRKVTFNPPPCDYLAVNEQTIAEQVAVYPNPAIDELNIEHVHANIVYQLCNVVGAVVRSGDLKTGEHSISIKHLPPGMYMLALTDEKGMRVVHKIVKE